MPSSPADHDHPGFALAASRQDGGLSLRVVGELDLATENGLRTALSGIDLGPEGSVRMHLAELLFADAASIDQLIGFLRTAQSAGREVAVTGARGVVLRMIELLGHGSAVAA